MKSSLLKRVIPHGIAILVFLILSCVYFAPQIQGKVISQTDTRSYEAFSHEMQEYKEETGKVPLWTNAIFSGMPGYQIGVPTKGNAITFLRDITQLFISRPIGYFLSAAICFYILLICLGVGPWLGILGAIGFAYTTNNLTLFEAGHNSKLETLIYLGPVIAGVILTFRKKYLLGGVLYSIALALAIYTGHYQMVYYLFLLLLVYGGMQLYGAVRAGTLPEFGKAAAILVLGTALAAGASASRLMSTAEYSRDTMRGAPILENNTKSTSSSSETEGLDWEYAMRWSNGIKDIAGTLIPRAAGGGSQEIVDESSNLYKDFRQRGINVPRALPIPMYHGNQPFTSGPLYLGAVFLFLFVLGAFLVKGRLKWWLVSAFVLSLLISMGSESAWLNKFLFDYFPMFNKFRAPSSMLGVTSLLVPVLGMLGLHHLVKGKSDPGEAKKALYYAAGIAGGVCLLLALLGPSLFDFSNPNDQSYAQAGYNIDALIADRKMYLQYDAIRSTVLVLLGAGAVFLLITKRIKALMAILLLGAFALFDLWGIDRRYVSEENFQTARESGSYFQLTDADRKILADDDLHYRVHDLTRDPWNDAYRAYWHKLIGGYHAAKLQRYQDIIDYYLSQGAENVLNMLNAKYILFTTQDNQIRVQPNYQALGNAWFVEGIRIVESADAEINALQNLDPAADAVIHKEFAAQVEGFDPVKSGSIELVSYHPEHLVYQSSAKGDQLAVFSEVWYGPDKGWQAYLDGEPVEHMRANYILRAMNVPDGEHKIEFIFHPESYYTGAALGYVSSGILLLLLAGALFKSISGYREEEETIATQAQQKKPSGKRKKRKPNRKG